MTAWVALVRAANVGGTGKLAMATLVAACERAGFARPRTFLASGNAVFGSDLAEEAARAALERALLALAGRDVGVLVRAGTEIADVAARNPFPDMPGDRVTALFTDEALPADPWAGATGAAGERLVAGRRELFVHYPDGMARTRLRLPAQGNGTARNMNTVAALARMAAEQ